jgi:hypothetical protein
MKTFHLVLILLVLAAITTLTCTTSANAAVLPEVEGADHAISTLYGGSDGQQVWYTYYKTLEPGDEGELLGVLNDVSQDLTPYALYGWYRVSGDLEDSNPEESHDYIYGIQYNTDLTPGTFAPFIATERVKFTSGPIIDRGYFGTGTRWDINDDTFLTGALWSDMAENYRVTCDASFIPHGSIVVDLTAWLLYDDGDEWGYWRAQATHPVGDDIYAMVVYEDSTRSDMAVLVGFEVRF